MGERDGGRREFLRRVVAGGAVLGGVSLGGRPLAAAMAGGDPGPESWSAERRVRELGLVLPEPVQQGTIAPAVRVGNLLYTSGQGPRREDGSGFVTGKVGADLTADQAYEAARFAGLVTLNVLRQQLGSLDNVVRVVKVLGMVNSTPDFTQQSRVINGFSELMIEVFGERGLSARSAVSVASLPGNWAVEVEGIFEVRG